jgi:hypothetical protein
MANETGHKTVDEIILEDDRRGISALRPHVPADSCARAARQLLDGPRGTVLVVTGFYEIDPGVIETDGPPGALAVGRALTILGFEPTYVTDRYALPYMKNELAEGDSDVVDFPIVGPAESQDFALQLLATTRPVAVIAVERCGMTADGSYLNMSGRDLAPYTARTDYLFNGGFTIGIGDGGNEIGMGGVADAIRNTPRLPDNPAVTKTDELIISSVSNWGAYGLVAALSALAGRDLLPTAEDEDALITRMAEGGAVDGHFLVPMAAVDGFSLEENARILEALRRAGTGGGEL